MGVHDVLLFPFYTGPSSFNYTRTVRRMNVHAQCACSKHFFLLYFPGRPVQSSTISTSLGSIQPHATSIAQSLLVNISTTVYSQEIIFTAE